MAGRCRGWMVMDFAVVRERGIERSNALSPGVFFNSPAPSRFHLTAARRKRRKRIKPPPVAPRALSVRKKRRKRIKGGVSIAAMGEESEESELSPPLSLLALSLYEKSEESE